MRKTNAMRILDSNKIAYDVISYDHDDGKIDGKSVAEKTGKDPKKVFKTLVTVGASGEHYVFVIPVLDELNLKLASKVCGEKKIEMLPVKEINKLTGYIRGGCSPIGMKKLFRTFFDASAESLDTIIISAGQIGLQIELDSNKLIQLVGGKYFSK